ncbi:type I-E CRISPR-associated protein Cas5/CasD [Trueperella bernardiae]|uniref:CRISPR-associated protein n=1 Tax=Trueperella bernardiae TaxID=59561 RepID=A0A0W1KLR5_9ACTO|nr:type I-E CRISPR-associated protein Cas5/CasD [Trueperella bernardiae]KTF04575.1 CRISPR-associated protein [Trueperella bernardiae]OCW59720.1 hypothetical protein AKG36_08845 [Trueperella bernardiae]PKZ89103.1 type I-E CRISPR-associated protein Cas5/CasD [Trueperella bernardiae]
MTTSFYVRLAGPLQSWAGASVTGNIVHTELEPTRSGLVGLLAGACGYYRGEWPSWLDDLVFIVRNDNRGMLTDDFQTINPPTVEKEFKRGLSIALGRSIRAKDALTHTPAGPTKKGARTAVITRTYIANGEFLVQITSNEHVDQIREALKNPVFTSYLGRKAFAPTFPFVLGEGSPAALAKIPVYRPHDRSGAPSARLQLKHLAPGVPPLAEITTVPTVRSRGEWLDAVRSMLNPL